MRARRMLAALAGAAALGAAGAAAATAQQLEGVVQHMTCVAPDDAAGIDAMLARASSPLAGEGATFVSESLAAGIDPRALVAMAAHETMLETYGPSQAINNAFGLGPGIAFASERDAIARAARTLAELYLPEGRTTLETIGSKWAPIGAANDPAGLNRNWTRGVGTYYAALGGDPSLPVLASAQSAVRCAGASVPATPKAPAHPGPAPQGPPVVIAWGGAAPARGPAPPDGFVFPLALPVGAAASYEEPPPGACAADGFRCGVTVASAAGAHAVAAATGTLRAATAAEREEGIAFWVEAGGDRLGYGPLAGYAPAIADGAAVAAGQPLGASAGSLRIAWERGGARLDPFPILEATRPPAG
ncbi:MAG TPA: hypothetical protein VK904_06085 [Miltoncostaeaceae bacterium]|nr:hypothetical protein [Miltoncostaeaceae bacterium]